MSDKAIDPGEGWRLLQSHECVERGDQFRQGDGWLDCDASIGDRACIYGQFRRRISAPSVERIDHAALPVDGSDGVVRSASLPAMTLRDWFAGQALAVLGDYTWQHDPEQTALSAYAIADAMLAERSKGEAK